LAVSLQERRYLRIDQRHQLWVHVAVVVSDIQTLHLLVSKQPWNAFLQTMQVSVLNDRDAIGPADIRSVDQSARVRAGVGSRNTTLPGDRSGLGAHFRPEAASPEGSGVLCILDERLGKRVNSKRCELDATNRSNIGEISNV